MIVLIVFIEVSLLLWFFLTFEFYFVLSIVAFLVYISYYMDGSEETGRRTWEGMRRWTYGLGIHYRWGDKKHFDFTNQYLFIVVGNVTNMGLIGGFGVHGRTFYNTCYLLPYPLFAIPIVRDVLLWTGAVSNKADPLFLLKGGWSVCYSPSGMNTQDVESGQVPDVGVFEFAMQHNVSIVPITIVDEHERYKIVNGPQRIQKWCLRRFGWPFPFFILPRCRGGKVSIEVGVPMDPSVQTNAQDFCSLFMGQIKRYTLMIY